MIDQERKNNIKFNRMTTFTKSSLEKTLDQTRKELKCAQLAIGEAAGTESDWHDNAAFDDANIKYDLVSVNLNNLNKKLDEVEIIIPRQQTDDIGIGNTVILKFDGEKDNEIFTILGPADARNKPDWISFESPLGSGLIGKKEGEEISFSIGDQEQKAKIIKILPGDF